MIDHEPIRKISLAIDGGHNIFYEIKTFLRDRAGFRVDLRKNGEIHAVVQNDPLLASVTAYHGEDIPLRLEEEVHHFAVIGRDKLRDAQLNGSNLIEVCTLGGISPCEVSLEVPKGMRVTRNGRSMRVKTPGDLDGCKIATSLPNIAIDYLEKNGAQITIVKYGGKEEGAPRATAADAVVAIWRSGGTARDNGLERLKGYETILKSEAVLASTGPFLEEYGHKIIVAQFIDRVKQAANRSEVPLEKPEKRLKFFVVEWASNIGSMLRG